MAVKNTYKIEENRVYIALVKTNGNIKIGDTIKTTGEALQASFSKNAMGMIVDAFGTDRISSGSSERSNLESVDYKGTGHSNLVLRSSHHITAAVFIIFWIVRVDIYLRLRCVVIA